MASDRGAAEASSIGLPPLPVGWTFDRYGASGTYETTRRREGEPYRKVHYENGAFGIVQSCWLPGSYATLDAAMAAFDVDDRVLADLAREDRPITSENLSRAVVSFEASQGSSTPRRGSPSP